MVKVGGLVRMEHTRYIRFNFHDVSCYNSATEVIKRVFGYMMFTVNFRGCVTDKLTFDERWERFETYINEYYIDNIDEFARHLTYMIIIDTFIYNIMHHVDIVTDYDLVSAIKSIIIYNNYPKCDISFINEVDTDENCIYLDMSTGYIEVH